MPLPGCTDEVLQIPGEKENLLKTYNCFHITIQSYCIYCFKFKCVCVRERFYVIIIILGGRRKCAVLFEYYKPNYPFFTNQPQLNQFLVQSELFCRISSDNSLA